MDNPFEQLKLETLVAMRDYFADDASTLAAIRAAARALQESLTNERYAVENKLRRLDEAMTAVGRILH